MEAKELMIGDWVHSVLDESNIQILYSEDLYAIMRYDDGIEPIPLNEEILLANGFKKVDLTIGNYALKLEEKGKYDVHTILWSGVFDGRMDLEFKVMGEHIHIDKKIRYVHELQHALRLCGLDDLADNFKVE